jgi:hypothetical protein
MPYRAYLDGDLMRIELSQHVTKADLAALVHATAAIETDLAVTPHRITDLRAWETSENYFEEIFAFANARKARTFRNAFKSAIVADKPAVMGTARMFQTLNDHPQITIRIFPTMAEAQAWIAE